MPLIDPYLIQQIREAADIVQIIGDTVALKRRGVQWVGLCPFHTEKTGSFNVNPERHKFHCFGCGAGGDVIDFLKEAKGLDWQTALKLAADRAGIHIDLDAKPGLAPKQFKKLAAPMPRVDEKEQWLDKTEIFQWRLRPMLEEFDEWIWKKGITRATVRELARMEALGIRRNGQLCFCYETGVKIRRDLFDSHSSYWAEGYAESPWLAAGLDSPEVTRVYICEGESDTMRLIPFLGPQDAVIGMPGASWHPTPAMCWRIGTLREVVTLCDGDSAGRETEKRLWPLLQEHAKRVKVGYVPIPEGEDVCTSSQRFLTKHLADPVWIR